MEESVTDLEDNGESFGPPMRIDGAMPRGYCGNLTGLEIQQVSSTCGRCQRLVKDECPRVCHQSIVLSRKMMLLHLQSKTSVE